MMTTTLTAPRLLTPDSREALPTMSPEALIASLDRAGLTGRGGAGFPVYRKFIAATNARQTSGKAPVMVANGCEGEPASLKDKTLLRTNPNLVLDGLRVAAEAIGAVSAYLAVEEGTGLAPMLRDLAELRGERVRIVETPARFISGEATALVAFLNGRRPLPMFQEPPVWERGVDGAPTLIQNIETLAQIALIARRGVDWFRGAETMLTTVHEAHAAPRVVEVEIGTPIRGLFSLDDRPVRAVLVGGYHGTWVSADEAWTRVARQGTGILAALPGTRCGVRETARVLRYLALQSAGQCGPCLNGLPRIAADFEQLAEARGPHDPTNLTRWADLVERRGACSHPDGTARLLRSALSVFADEVAAHGRGTCTATDSTPLLPVPEEG